MRPKAPQRIGPDVASFEVKDINIRIMDYYAELNRADVMVQYKGVMNKKRDYHKQHSV